MGAWSLAWKAGSKVHAAQCLLDPGDARACAGTAVARNAARRLAPQRPPFAPLGAIRAPGDSAGCVEEEKNGGEDPDGAAQHAKH